MRRLLAMFRKRRLDCELDEELSFHLDLETEANLRRGMTPDQARREALRSFGGIQQTREAYRDRRGLPFLESIWQDLVYGMRSLRRNRGFAAVAILTLALGIGATVAIFSVVDTVLLKPLPFREADRLVVVQQQVPKLSLPFTRVPAPDSVEYRKSAAFEEAGVMIPRSYDLSSDGGPERVNGMRVSANLLPMLGAAPLAGRLFTSGEERQSARVAVLSNGLWRRRYGGDLAVIGRSVLLNREPYVIVGVMPASFVFPPKGLPYDPSADIWTPLSLTPAELNTYMDNLAHTVVGRLRAGVSMAQASAEVDAIARRLQAALPAELTKMLPPGIEIHARVTPLKDEVVGRSKTLLLLLLGAVGAILLIACANVASMLLSRAATRHREMALRAALGAGRARLMRQLLTESLLLSIAGGALGTLFALWGTGLLAAVLPGDLPLVEQIRVDGRALAFAIAASAGAGLLFGFAPSFGATSQSGFNEPLKEPARRGRLLGALVSGQVAAALALLCAAGLLVRSFVELRNQDTGFRTEHLLTASLALPASHYPATKARDFYRGVIPAVRSLPGAEIAGMASEVPLEGAWSRVMTAETAAPGQMPVVHWALVLGDYFQALGTPLKRGRFFTGADAPGAERVAIVNETLVRQVWPGEDPIGKRLTWGPREANLPWLKVVGVVADINQSAPGQKVLPHVYEAYAQSENRTWIRRMHLVLRTSGDPLALANAVRSEIARLDPELPVTNLRAMEQILDDSMTPRRMSMWLVTVFAIAALLLASLGVYGVMAYAVTTRTREIGIRMALGATRTAVARMVIGRGMKLVAAGVALGAAASAALTRLMEGLLHGVSPTDPPTFGALALLLGAVSLLAHIPPLRRAIRVDPVSALRHE